MHTPQIQRSGASSKGIPMFAFPHSGVSQVNIVIISFPFLQESQLLASDINMLFQ
jgi:hypothetical protein